MRTIKNAISDPDDRLPLLAAAYEAGCHISTLSRRIRSGELRAERRFGRWLIRRADLNAMLAAETGRRRGAGRRPWGAA